MVIGWNIWIALSLLSMIAIPALYGVIYNDVATGIAMWIVLQLFSLPGYIVAYFDFKDKLKKIYAIILIVIGCITLGFLTYVYPECLISFIGLIVTAVIRIVSPNINEMSIEKTIIYRNNSSYPDVIIGEVDKPAYILLAIFLGAFGVHRFYAGKIVSGFVYVLLFFIMISPLLGIIDGLVAIGSPTNENGKLPVYKNKFFV